VADSKGAESSMLTAPTLTTAQNSEPARTRGMRGDLAGKLWDTRLFLGTAAILLVAWEVVPRIFDIHQIVLPPLSRVVGQVVSNPGTYLASGAETFVLVVYGFLAGGLLGVLGAVGIYYSRIIRRGVYPYLFAMRIVPKLAFLPLFMVWFGVGDLTKVMLAASAIFFLVLVQTLLGLESIEQEYVEFGRSLKMREWDIFRKIRVPTAMPCMMVGFKLGITYALTNVIVAEMVVGDSGLGLLLVEGEYRLRTYEVMAGIAVVSIGGLALYALATYVERRTTSWHYDER
jgi:NitT/TauT family transport system permease protein